MTDCRRCCYPMADAARKLCEPCETFYGRGRPKCEAPGCYKRISKGQHSGLCSACQGHRRRGLEQMTQLAQERTLLERWDAATRAQASRGSAWWWR